jgi:hypothetical protein
VGRREIGREREREGEREQIQVLGKKDKRDTVKKDRAIQAV